MYIVQKSEIYAIYYVTFHEVTKSEMFPNTMGLQ